MFGSFKSFLNKIEDKVIAIDARSRDALRPPESVQRAADQVQSAAHQAEDSVTRRLNDVVSASQHDAGRTGVRAGTSNARRGASSRYGDACRRRRRSSRLSTCVA